MREFHNRESCKQLSIRFKCTVLESPGTYSNGCLSKFRLKMFYIRITLYYQKATKCRALKAGVLCESEAD